MIRIFVKTPVKSRPTFSYYLHKRRGGGTMSTVNPVTVVRRLENKLKKCIFSHATEPKINVRVRYPGGTNEGEYSNKKHALHALVCFLEDFLPRDYRVKKEKLYHP